ncbi:MAG: ATP synthase F1 subunit epsilon [Opitutae bacterium]|nr:ATP synthase F1 subunit epsilon [Opitutae bacterium]MBT7924377.1 ATP synthase F1 subunit epsilon [Opitutae bacterium]
MPLLLEIVTPDAKVFSETVDEVGLPTSEGRMHILPHHVPVIAKLKAGEIKVHRGNDIEMLAVGSGFIEVYGDKVSILTDQAINVEEIDDTEIEEAVKRAKEALEEGKKSNIDAAEIDRLEAEARFAFAKQIARAKRR